MSVDPDGMETLKRHLSKPITRGLGAVLLIIALIASMTSCSAQDAINSNFGTGWLGQQATRIAQCESGMNPNAVSSTNDHGLFQINGVHAGTFAAVTGQPFYNGVYNPYYNAQFARWLYNQTGSWSAWSCRYVL